MRSLNSQEKRLFSKIGLILIIIIVIGFSYWGISTLSENWQNKRLQERQQLIQTYESRVDSLNKVNMLFITQINELDVEIDSLRKVKAKIYWKYEEKANAIHDDNAMEHAQWMDSILTELNYYRK